MSELNKYFNCISVSFDEIQKYKSISTFILPIKKINKDLNEMNIKKIQLTWFMHKTIIEKINDIKLHIEYGTFGYEGKIKDHTTQRYYKTILEFIVTKMLLNSQGVYDLPI